MRKIKNYHADRSFVDLLFNIFLGFIALFFIALLMINPVRKKSDVKLKAEFLIKVVWPENSEQDIDTYFQDPIGNLVWFGDKDAGLMHIDRDDLGSLNDKVLTKAGQILLKENREIVTIRGIVPGEYCLNIHLYNDNSNYDYSYDYSYDSSNGNGYYCPIDENGNPVDKNGNLLFDNPKNNNSVEVNIEIIKLNPYKIVLIKNIVLSKIGEEKTVCRFSINKDGEVTDINNLEKSLVESNSYNEENKYGEVE